MEGMMNQNQSSPRRLIAAMAETVRSAMLWFAGVPADALDNHRKDTQMEYTAIGLVIGTWYVLMMVIWAKSGLYYFGPIGAGVFVLVPTLILALDRMVIRGKRNPSGDLSSFSVRELRTPKIEYWLRIAAAISFSAVSTEVFLLTEAGPDIRARQQQDQFIANAPLREEMRSLVETRHNDRKKSIQSHSDQIEADIKTLNEDLNAARHTADDAEKLLRKSSFNAAAEVGGIEGRVAGSGPRHDAYVQLARQGEMGAKTARVREAKLREGLNRLQVQLQDLHAMREAATKERNESLRDLEDELQKHPRYVARKGGLFADATTLIRLYGDKDLGPGLVLSTILAVSLLFTLETMPLLGMTFRSSTPYDVERIALNRADAARLVAEKELEIMRETAKRTVHVRPMRPGDKPVETHRH